jgi:hypothetical protein
MKKLTVAPMLILIGLQWIATTSMIPGATQQQHSDEPPTPTPAFDRLAVPTLPANPSPEEFGSYLYYYHCMPCHGDQGQGLTEEWRMVWVEDHRNCWDRGCHGGRQEDEGFPLPKIIPAVIAAKASDSPTLMQYTTSDQLLAYLKATHPPQYPGHLKDEEYQALAVYLWAANRRGINQTMIWRIGIVILALVTIAALAFFLQHKKRKTN